MKNIYYITLIACAILCSEGVSAQKFPDLDKSPADIAYLRGKDKLPVVKVIYGRPQKKGRKVFGDLEQFGKVWRTGANEATEIKFFKDVKIGDKDVKAGTYSLFSIPDSSTWTMIINTETDIWGAYTYNKEKDVLRTVVKTQTLPTVVEAFSIIFKENETGGNLILAWDKTMVELPIVVSK